VNCASYVATVAGTARVKWWAGRRLRSTGQKVFPVAGRKSNLDSFSLSLTRPPPPLRVCDLGARCLGTKGVVMFVTGCTLNSCSNPTPGVFVGEKSNQLLIVWNMAKLSTVIKIKTYAIISLCLLKKK
jgi:hypothetical protein